MKMELTQEEAEVCYKILRSSYVDLEIWSQDVDEDRSEDLAVLDSILDRLAEIANIDR